MSVEVAVRCVESGITFESLTETAAYTDTSVGAVLRAIQSKTALHGLHYEYVGSGGRQSVKDRLKRNKCIRKDRESGMPVKEIAEKYGLSYQAAWNVIRGNETDKKANERIKSRMKRDKSILMDKNNGMTYKQLCDKYHVSMATVGNALKRARVNA